MGVLRGSIHIAQKAEGPWFIICHGFTAQRMGPGYLFVKVSRTLAEAGFSSIRFDFRGSGESDGNFCDMNASTMQSDLLFILNKCKNYFKPSHIILLGHSFGGMIASLTAGKVDAHGLVLISPVADPTGLAQRRQSIIESGPNTGGFYENGPHEMNISFLDSLKGIDPVKQMICGFNGELLLIQGDKDDSISVKESGRYVHMARKTGIKTSYFLFPGADHNYSKVIHVKNLCRTITTWAKERFL